MPLLKTSKFYTKAISIPKREQSKGLWLLYTEDLVLFWLPEWPNHIQEIFG